MAIETDIFALRPAVYVGAIMRRWLLRYAWLFALAAVACTVAAVAVSAAFAFVGLMLALIVFPSALMMVYFNYALKPDALRQTSPHTLLLSDTELQLCPRPDEERPTSFGSLQIALTDIASLRLTKHTLTIATGTAVDDIIILPADAFTISPDDADRFIQSIYRSFQQKSVTLQS